MGWQDDLEYNSIRNNNGEVLTSDRYQLEFVTKPIGVYFPANDAIINQRLIEVSLPGESAIEPLKIKIAHIELQQATRQTPSAGESTFKFQDFEDQSIEATFMDILNKMRDRDKLSGVHKSYYQFDYNVYQLNSSRKPVAKYVFKGCQVAAVKRPSTYNTTETTNMQEIEVTISHEYWDKVLMNG